MLISFYEEFPTESNLKKLNLIDFPTKLYIASESFSKFNKIKKNIKSRYVKEIIYWPVLKKEEGYWFSPFSKNSAIQRTLNELNDKSIPVMWDAELPTHPNPLLYFTQFFNFFKNRDLIKNFIYNRERIYISEYFFVNDSVRRLLQFLALIFQNKSNIFPMKMHYSSMHDFSKNLLEHEIKKGKKLYGKNLIMAYGVLIPGILKTEKTISLKLLERDLKLAKKHNVNEVVLYRLGGLNRDYINLLRKFDS